MAFVSTNDCVELDLRLVFAGQHIEMTFHLSVPATITSALLETLANILLSWWDSTLYSSLSNQLGISGVQATSLESATAPSIFVPYAGAHPVGTVTGDPVPTGSAMVVTKRTDLRGRSYRGRNYFPGLGANTLSTAALWDNDAMTSVLAWYGALHDDFLDAAAVPVVLSMFTAGSPRAHGVMTPISVYSIDNSVDSQRRRLAGRGN